MGFTISGSQNRDPSVLCEAIISTLKNGGGTSWFTELVTIDDTSSRQSLLESTVNVDSILSIDASQTYRLLIRGIKTGTPSIITELRIYWGTNEQLKVGDSNTIIIAPNTPYTVLWVGTKVPNALTEYSYRISLTSRGFVVGLWTIPTVNSIRGNSILCIQRPVNPTNGTAKQNGKAPVFAISHSSTDIDTFYLSVVRELDINSSSALISLNAPSATNLYRFSFDWSHPNLFDNYSHVIKFPFGFATTRHIYLDELDLICLVNGGSFVSGQTVSITMYGESSERQYSTIWGDAEYGRIPASSNEQPVPKILGGSRIGILSSGGGI